MRYDRLRARIHARRAADLDLFVPPTLEARTRGLQGIALGPYQGMVFPAEEGGLGRIAMHMGKVDYPIGMIWIDRLGRVNAVEKPDPGDPRVFDHPGAAVIEVHKGLVEALGVVPGAFCVLREATS